MTNFVLWIDPKIIKAAIICASTEQTRYYLNGVFFQKRGNVIRIVSTDGHRLFAAVKVLEEWEEKDFECILPLADLKKALTGITNRVDQVMCDFMFKSSGDGVNVVFFNQVQMTPIDGTYPDTSRLLPDDRARENKETQQFDARYVGDMAKIAKALGHHGNAVHIQHCGGSPAIISFAGRDDVMALLMPMRSEHTAQLGTIRAGQLLGAAPFYEQISAGVAA